MRKYPRSEVPRLLNVYQGISIGSSPYRNSLLKSIDDAVSGGSVVTIASGNQTLDTWFGNFSDTDGDGALEFASGDECNAVYLRADQQFVLQLRWQDIWRGATTDLDVYLNQTSGDDLVVVASGEDEQSGSKSDDPYELIVFTPETSETYCLGIRHRVGEAPSWVQMQSFTGESLEHHTLSHSIGNPAETKTPGRSLLAPPLGTTLPPST